MENKINCENCGEEFEPHKFKPSQRFCSKKCCAEKYHQENRKEILEKQKIYRLENQEQIKEMKKKYHQANKVTIIEKVKKWKQENIEKVKRWAEENKERRKELWERWAEENKEILKEKDKRNYHENKERYKELNKKWVKEHPEQIKIIKHRRRARLNNNGGSVTAEEIIELKKESRGFCIGWKRELHFVGLDKLEIDHILALAKGGKNSIENIQLLCKSCNSSKGVN